MSENWNPAQSELDLGIRGLSLNDVQEDTKAVACKHYTHGRRVEPLVTPIYTSTTYRIDSVDGYLDILQNGGYIYSRLGNPSCEAAECTINALEGGAGSMVFSSGMAAITTGLTGVLKAGDHIVAQNPLYSGAHKYMSKYLCKFNVDVTWVEAGCDVVEFKKHIKPNTRVLYGETPANPEISILDLEAFGALGKSNPNVVTMVDVTYATPFLLQPIKYGIDLSIHSATKYLGGHSDLIAGVITCRTLEMWKELNVYRTTLGNTLSPFDASLLLRGLKSLPVRMERHSQSAQKIAEFLHAHPKVSRVCYPGLPSHPGHEVAKRQMKMYSGMIAFDMKDGLEPAKSLVRNVKLIEFAVSLGGVESLIEHAASMTHGPMIMSDEERRESKITDGLIRLSIGLENADDLIQDLKQALEKA